MIVCRIPNSKSFIRLSYLIIHIHNILYRYIIKQIQTMHSAIILVITTLLAVSLQADCNFTHFQYFSNFSLGKQEQLNKTFDEIVQFVKVPNITYKDGVMNTYNLNNLQVEFRYIDSNQKAVIIGNDTVGIYGGKLEATLSFDWVKTSMVVTNNGSGIARIYSSEIMFEKLLQIDEGYLDYLLGFYYNITFQFNNFTIVRIDPPNTSDNDTACILKALNDSSQTSQSAKVVMQKKINQLYASVLRRNLRNQHYPLDDHFEYTWKSHWEGITYTIPFALVPTGVDLEKDGLQTLFVSFIKDDPKWKCGKMIPSVHENPQIYGGIQQFISYSIFENTVRYAGEKFMLNSTLNRANWESRFFQFYAGDLYEIIPKISDLYLAMESVSGKCTYNTNFEFVLKKHNNTVFNTSTSHHCTLHIAQSLIVQFQIKVNFQVDVLGNETNLNFKIIHVDGKPIFKTAPGFEIKNLELAEHMVSHSLNRFKEGYTFGSGWKIFPRDSTHIKLEDDYIIIYDPTHVGEEII